MSGRLVEFLLVLVVFSLSKVDALHEDVVDGILAKVSNDFKNVDSQPGDFFYSTTKKLGQLSSTLRVELIMGRLVLEGISRSNNVTYTENGDEAPVSFEFTGQLKAFFAYRYRFTVSSSKWSFGNAVGGWSSTVQVKVELGPDDCSLKLAKWERSTDVFDVEIDPADSFFFPATIHLSAGNELEKQLDRHVNRIVETSFNGKKICDCISC